MYVIYEDDFEQTAFPSMDSDGRIEVIWDHRKFKNVWSARWAPWPYDSKWRKHELFNAETTLDVWGPYPILLLHFGLWGVSSFLDPGKIISSSPEAILEFKHGVATSTVKPGSVLPARPACFISYSSADTGFVRRLISDLTAAGVRCWYAPEDLRIGDDILEGLRQAISLNDKVVLVISEASISSGWVSDEVNKTFADERSSGALKLLPIMIDDSLMSSTIGWVGKIRESRNVGDFRGWEDESIYRRQLERFLRDLAP
jgi:hypothetical protein